jgi:hypothetical protein
MIHVMCCGTGIGLYMLWTRWGRVGETGKHQRTPYQKKDEAVDEFEKIFKSKSGNPWAERNPPLFQPKDGRYTVSIRMSMYGPYLVCCCCV